MASDRQSYYLAIDLKSFYASVECVERNLDPLTANLVVADESRTDKTICLAVSPSLKSYGLPGRCRLFEVEQKAEEIERQTGERPDYIVAPPRMALYEKYSADIYAIYLNYVSSDDIHVYSIDEVFIDVTRYLSLYRVSPHRLARTMLKEVYETKGITGTAGIGTNLYLAKIAMDIGAKHIPPDEDGVRIKELDEMTYRREFWGHRPLTDFWRVGRGTRKRLEGSGMFTMGDVARVSVFDEDLLYRMFGIDAEILIDHAWGYEPCGMEDIKAYKPRTNCFSSGQVLMCPYSAEKARIVMREMTEEMVLELVEKDKATGSLTLIVGYDRENVDRGEYRGPVHIDHYGRKVPESAHGTVNLGSPSSSTSKIVGAVLKKYDEIVNPSLLVRRITLSANQVVERGFEQFDLLTDPEQLEKERRLQKAMIGIRERFGKNALLKGTNLQEGATSRERNGQIGGHRA